VGPRAGPDTGCRKKSSYVPGIEPRSPSRPTRSQTCFSNLTTLYFEFTIQVFCSEVSDDILYKEKWRS
jgi:hypothetical protein